MRVRFVGCRGPRRAERCAVRRARCRVMLCVRRFLDVHVRSCTGSSARSLSCVCAFLLFSASACRAEGCVTSFSPYPLCRRREGACSPRE
jgi:hypothetical protein